LYPYGLATNPFPETLRQQPQDPRVFGGPHHKAARAALWSALEQFQSRALGLSATDAGQQNPDRGTILLSGVAGSGKTHLAMHLRDMQFGSHVAAVTHISLPSIRTRDVQGLHIAMMEGFGEQYSAQLREALVKYLLEKAERNVEGARKVFNFDFVDVMSGRSLASKAKQVLAGEMVPNNAALCTVLAKDSFSPEELGILKQVLYGSSQAGLGSGIPAAASETELLSWVRAMSSLNLRFLKKITLFEFDDLGPEADLLKVIRAICDAKFPAAAVLLIVEPSLRDQIASAEPSIADVLSSSLELDLPLASFEEVLDIALEYIRAANSFDATGFSSGEEGELASKIKVIYDEFPELRGIRSFLNIMYHSFEDASKRSVPSIDEHAIDETMKNAHPGLRISESMMDIPLSEFIRIKRSCSDNNALETGIRTAVRDLVSFTHQVGMVARPVWAQKNPAQASPQGGIDVVYSSTNGSKVAVAVVMNNNDSKKSSEQISNTLKSTQFVDKVVILTDAAADAEDTGSIVSIDRRRMIDLIYFSNKYKNNSIQKDDSEKAVNLARSIRLC
jgi:hypothetical protein